MREKRFFSAADNIRMSSEQKEKLFRYITAEIDMAENEGTEIVFESKPASRLRNIIFPAAAVVMTGIAVISALPALQKNETIPAGNSIPDVTEVQTTEFSEISSEETVNAYSEGTPKYDAVMHEGNYLIGSYDGTNYFASRQEFNETSLCISPEGRKLFTGDGKEFTEIYNIALYESRYVVYGNTDSGTCRLSIYDSSFENPVDAAYTGTRDTVLKFTVSGDTLVAASCTRGSDCIISSFSMQTGEPVNKCRVSSVTDLWAVGASAEDKVKAVIINEKYMVSAVTLDVSSLTVTDSTEISQYDPDIFNCAVRNGDIIFSRRNREGSAARIGFTRYNSDGTETGHVLDTFPEDYPVYPADFGSGFDFHFMCYGNLYGYTFETDSFELLAALDEQEFPVNYRPAEASFDTVFFRYNDTVCRTEHTYGCETLICSDAECSKVLYTLQDDILEECELFTRSFNGHVFWLNAPDTRDSIRLCDLNLVSGETIYTDFAVDPEHFYLPYEFAVTDRYLITYPDNMYNSMGSLVPNEKNYLCVYSRAGEFIRTVSFPEGGEYSVTAREGGAHYYHLFITDRQEPVIILESKTYSGFDISAWVLNSEADAFEKYDQDIQPYMFASAFQPGTDGYSFYWFDRYGVYGFRRDTGKSDTLLTFADNFYKCPVHGDDLFTQAALGSDGELYLNRRFHGVTTVNMRSN